MPERRSAPPERIRRPAWLWLIPVVSLLLTGIAWHVTRVSSAARVSERLGFRAAMIETVLEQRLQGHVNVLRGVVGLFDASAIVAPAEWESYLRTVHPETSSPGLQAIGFSARVPETDQTRVEYVHPVEHDNLDALGTDMFTEPIRREAMIRARDQNAPALSRQVRLVQEGGRGTTQPGFLLYLPVYQPGRPASSVAERRAALRGYVYGVFRAQDLMTSTFGGQHWDLDFEIYDGAVVTRSTLLFRSEPERVPVAGTAGGNGLAQRVSVEIAGHRWLLIARPSATFFSFADRYQHWVLAGGGLAINLLVGIGLWASAAVRKRALVIAEGMSHAVRVSEAQTRLMVDSITDHAIFRLDAERNVTSWNASAERMLGYGESEVVSHPASRFWVGADGNPYSDEAGIAERQVREGWHVRKDGHRFWGAAAVAPLQHGTHGSAGYVVILRDDTSRRQAIEALAATSSALEQRTIELGRFNRLASGRELRMIELKRMVNERSVRLGMSAPFDLSFTDGFADVQRPGERS